MQQSKHASAAVPGQCNRCGLYAFPEICFGEQEMDHDSGEYSQNDLLRQKPQGKRFAPFFAGDGPGDPSERAQQKNRQKVPDPVGGDSIEP